MTVDDEHLAEEFYSYEVHRTIKIQDQGPENT